MTAGISRGTVQWGRENPSQEGHTSVVWFQSHHSLATFAPS